MAYHPDIYIEQGQVTVQYVNALLHSASTDFLILSIPIGALHVVAYQSSLPAP